MPTSQSVGDTDANETAFEVNPLKSTLTVPKNKTSVWVYQLDQLQLKEQQQEPLSKVPAAVWSTGTFVLEKIMTRQERLEPMELWTFFDDDPVGIEESIVRNNPQQGLWGYHSTVKCRVHSVRPLLSQLPLRPDQLVIVPPNGDVPEGLQVAGLWIRPQYKRDVSALADGTVGFLQVSGSLERFEKHSVGGAWKMLAFNDEMDRGQKVKRPDKPSTKHDKPQKRKSSVPDDEQEPTNSKRPPKPPQSSSKDPVITPKSTGKDPTKIHVKDPKDKEGRRTIAFPFDPTKSWDVPSVLEPIAKTLNRNPRKVQLVEDDTGLPVTPDRPPIPGNVYSIRDVQPEKVNISVPSNNKNFVLLVDPNTDGLPQILEKAKKQAGILPDQPFSLIPDDNDNAKKPNPNQRSFVLIPDNDPTDDPPEMMPPPSPKKPKVTPLKIQTPNKSRTFFLYIDPEPPSSKTLSKRPKDSLSMLPTNTPKEVNKAIAEQGEPNARVFFIDPEGNRLKDDDPLSNADKDPEQVLSMERLPIATIQNPNKSRTFYLYIDPEPPSPKTIARRPKNALSMLPSNTPKDVNEAIAGRGEPNARVFFFDPEGNQLKDDDPLSNADKDPEQVLSMERLPIATIQTPNKSRNFYLYVDPEPPSSKILSKRPKNALSMLPTNTPKDVNEAIAELGEPNARVFFFDPEGNRLKDDDPLSKAEMDPEQVLSMERLPFATIQTPNKSRTFALYIDPEPPSSKILSKRPKNALSMLPTNTPKDVNEAIAELGEPNARVFFFDHEGNPLGDHDPLKLADKVRNQTLTMETKPLETEPSVLIATPDESRTFALYIDPEPPSPKTLAKRPKNALSMLPTSTPDDVNQAIGLRNARVFFMDADGDLLEDDEPLTRAALDLNKVLRMEQIPNAMIETPSKSRTFVLYIDPEPPPRKVLAKRPKNSLSMLPTNTPDDVNIAIGERNARVFFMDSDGNLLDDDAPLMHADLNLDRILRMERIPDALIETPCKTRTFALYIDQEPPSPKSLAKRPKTSLSMLSTSTPNDVNMALAEQGERQARVFFMDAAGNPLNDDDPLTKAALDLDEILRLHPVDDDTFTFRTKSGRTFVLHITPEDTIMDVQRKLRAKSNLEVGAFRLGDLDFDDVDEDELFRDHVRPGFILDAEPPKVEIRVPGTAEKIRMAILPTTTMRDVEKVVEEKLYNGKKKAPRVFLFDSDESVDMKTPILKKLNFEKGWQMEVRDFELEVAHWDGKRVTLNVQTTEYIGDVKEKIARSALQVPIDQQNLTLNGQLVDEALTLKAQNITPTSVLKLEPMKIYLMPPSGKKIAFLVKLSASIVSVKKKACQKTKIPMEVMCLMSGSTEYANEKSLGECKVMHKDTIHVEIFRLEIMDIHGEQTSVTDLKPTDTIKTLKKRIEKVANVPKAKQVLRLESRLIDDDGTLSSQGIRHRSVLTVVDSTKVDLSLPASEQRRLKTMKTKKFKSTDEDIWPVIPDWKNRIFFFDIDDSLDSSLIALTIMHWKGENFLIPQVKLGWSLHELKQHIFKLERISTKREKFLFNGKELDSSRTLRQQGLQHKSILVMDGRSETNLNLPNSEKLNFMASLGALPTFMSDSIRLTIRHWLGHEFVVEAQPSDYLDDVKETIFAKKKIPVDFQRITYNNLAVDETVGLGDQGIITGCILQLEPMEISIIQSSSAREVRLIVESDDTIRDVKYQILRQFKMPIELQCIMLGGEELPDSKTLQECAVDHLDVLLLEEFALSVMHWLGGVFRLSGIHPDSTVSEVKSEVFRVRHVPKKKQVLTYKGATLQNNKTLADYSIGHKSVLILDQAPEAETSEQPRRLFNFMESFDTTPTSAPAIKLTVQQSSTGESFSVGADPNEYADDIREEILRECRIPIDEQHLSFRGSPLRDDVNLGDQGIVDGSVLKLDPMRIYLEKPSGDRVLLAVEKDWTIRFVKQKAAQVISSSEDFCIMLGGKELHDGESLRENNIKNEDTLVLEVFKISVVDAFGSTPLKIRKVRLRSTVASVKRAIAKLKSIPVERQKLSFQGRELSDKKTLLDECIKNKSSLMVEEVEPIFDVNPVKSKFIFSAGSVPSAMDVMSAKNEHDKSRDDDGGSDSDSSMRRLDAVLAKIRKVDDSSPMKSRPEPPLKKSSGIKSIKSPNSMLKSTTSPKAVIHDMKSPKSRSTSSKGSTSSTISEKSPANKDGSSKKAKDAEKRKTEMAFTVKKVPKK